MKLSIRRLWNHAGSEPIPDEIKQQCEDDCLEEMAYMGEHRQRFGTVKDSEGGQYRWEEQ